MKINDHDVRNSRSGLVYMGLSAISFSLMAALVKLGGRGIDEQQIIALRSLFIIAIVVPVLRKKRVPIFGNNIRLLLLRGLLGYVAMSCYFWTLQRLPVADSMVIQYTSPIFTILWSVLFLREKSQPAIWVAAIVSLIGVGLIAGPSGEGSVGVASVGIVGAALAGGAYATVRKLRETDDPYSIVLYFPLVSLPFAIVLGMNEWRWNLNIAEWCTVAGICVASYGGQIFLTKALRAESASRAIVINYLAVALGLFYGLFLFDQVLSIASLTGIGLILSGVSLLSLQRRQTGKNV